ncbi:hypothetical protein GCM10010177_46890 [Actinomadura citrea]|nr:hypothetical protein GCM10010177_46890 [Actinomadura citrea]
MSQFPGFYDPTSGCAGDDLAKSARRKAKQNVDAAPAVPTTTAGRPNRRAQRSVPRRSRPADRPAQSSNALMPAGRGHRVRVDEHEPGGRARAAPAWQPWAKPALRPGLDHPRVGGRDPASVTVSSPESLSTMRPGTARLRGDAVLDVAGAAVGDDDDRDTVLPS